MCFFTASGEPPICMSSSALFAVKKAIVAARAEINNKEYFSLCKLFYVLKVIVTC